MRFWLRWAIVTLPVVVCIVLWIRSYSIEEGFNRTTHHSDLTVGVTSGKLFTVFLRADDWNFSESHWTYVRRDHAINEDSSYPRSHFLGFGYQYDPSPGGIAATIAEVPIWFASLLAAIPPLWLYRRHRRRRRTGFPMGSLD